MRLFVAVCCVAHAAAFGFTVPAGKSECFHEAAKTSERLSGEWKVLKGGMMDLDVQASFAGPRSVALPAG